VRPGRVDEPVVDQDIDIRGLDPDIRRELSTLAPAVADRASAHLLMTARLVDDDPERAYAHAQVVRRLAGRLAIARETIGFAAYRTQRWAEALSELRAARRMTGAPDYLPMIADCERGLGRPERAIAALNDADASRLDRGGKIELRIVAAGARRDMGQAPAAVAALQGRDLNDENVYDWTARLRYAYADALLEVGRRDEAIRWFEAAVEADSTGQTDAQERLAELGAAEPAEFDVLASWDEEEDEEPEPSEG
jgi:tetratricopeptide (TPR) repeat protein